MLQRIWRVVENVGGRLAVSYRRFPEPLALAFSTVLILIYLNHNYAQGGSDPLLRLALILAMGIPLTLCLRMLAERGRRVSPILAYILVALFLWGYYHYLLPDENMVALTRYLAVNVAFYLFFVAIPYWGRQTGFEQYVLELGLDFATTYLYSVVLFTGLAAILFTINALFAVGIPGKVYLDLFLLVAGIFAPAYFLAGIPAPGGKFQGDPYPGFLQTLFLYIVMPLLSVYTAILYVYFLKILVTRDWPEGIVSHLVLWYALVGIFVIFSVYPLRERNRWVAGFVAVFPKLILPLLFMLFVAMGIRIRAYGVTENRYLVLAGGLWSTGMMGYYALKKKAKSITVVLSAALVALLVVSGPWSAYAVSKASQNRQLERILLQNDMLVEGKIVPSPSIPQGDKERITSILDYFNKNHSLADVAILPPSFTLEQMEEVFGFGRTYGGWENPYFRHYLGDTGFLTVTGYDYYLALFVGRKETLVREGEGLTFTYTAPYFRIEREGQVLYEKDLNQVALAIHAAHGGELALTEEDMTFVEENEHLRIMFRFQHIEGREEGDEGLPQIEWMDLVVLVKVF